MPRFEADQVRKGAGPNGEDVSVPINVAYNHHYAASLLGEGSRMERVRYDPNDPRTTLFTPEPGWDFIPVEHTPSSNGLPTSVWAGYSNGGEFRKTYHTGLRILGWESVFWGIRWGNGDTFNTVRKHSYFLCVQVSLFSYLPQKTCSHPKITSPGTMGWPRRTRRCSSRQTVSRFSPCLGALHSGRVL